MPRSAKRTKARACPLCHSERQDETRQPATVATPQGTFHIYTSGTIFDCPHPWHDGKNHAPQQSREAAPRGRR